MNRKERQEEAKKEADKNETAKSHELKMEKENSALKKLQAAAGLVDKSQVERLDWMYEQSAVQQKKTDEELMNMPIEGQSSKDLEDVKALGENISGSLFLKSATKTTEDMLRKLREDPLFQIRREEQNARAQLLSNPLVMQRIQKKQQKLGKKEKKKVKKAQKKEKKHAKKAAKKDKKANKKGKSSSSDSSADSDDSGAAARGAGAAAHGGRRSASRSPRRKQSQQQSEVERPGLGARRAKEPEKDLSHLGPSGAIVSRREEFAKQTEERKELALASRGAPRRMSEEEKKRKLDEMRADANRHDKRKDERILAAEKYEKEIDERDEKSRATSDQSYLREVRKEAFGGGQDSMADRLKSQRHRRQKNMNDPLERDDK